MKTKGFAKVLTVRSVKVVYYWEDDEEVGYQLDATYPSDVDKGKSEQVSIIIQVNGACGARPEPDTLLLRINIEGDKSTAGVWNNYGMVIRVPSRVLRKFPDFRIMPSSYYQCDTAALVRATLEGAESANAD
jgi:hypothetical protein